MKGNFQEIPVCQTIQTNLYFFLKHKSIFMATKSCFMTSEWTFLPAWHKFEGAKLWWLEEFQYLEILSGVQFVIFLTVLSKGLIIAWNDKFCPNLLNYSVDFCQLTKGIYHGSCRTTMNDYLILPFMSSSSSTCYNSSNEPSLILCWCLAFKSKF